MNARNRQNHVISLQKIPTSAIQNIFGSTFIKKNYKFIIIELRFHNICITWTLGSGYGHSSYLPEDPSIKWQNDKAKPPPQTQSIEFFYYKLCFVSYLKIFNFSKICFYFSCVSVFFINLLLYTFLY